MNRHSAFAQGRALAIGYDTEAGHSGGLPVTKTIADVTERLLFVMWQLGMVGMRTAS